MKTSKLLWVGVLALSLGMTGSGLGQECSALLTSGVSPTGATFNVGDTVHYTIFVQVPDVPGACTLTNVSIWWFPPPLGPHIGGDLNLTACDSPHPTDGVLIASGLTLAPGDPLLTFTAASTGITELDYVVQPSDAGGDLHADAAFVFDIPGVGTPQCDEKASQNTVVCPEPCVEITKELVPDSPTFSKVGDTVHYRICITNCGTFDLTDVVVNDPLLGGDLAGFPDTLTPDQQVCLDFDYTVQQGDPDPLVNTVTVTGIDACDGETQVSDEASFTVDLVQPAIDIVKECTPPTASVGDLISYTITITNTGNVDLENITVDDSLLGDLSASFVDTLAVGASDIQIFTRTLEDTDPIPLVNTATVNATVVELGNPVSDEDSCEVTQQGDTFCSFTQGFWGNAGGKACDGTSTEDLISGCVPVVVGLPGHSITLGTAQCIIDLLPAGGKPAVLPAGDFTCATIPASLKNKQGRFNNVLIGQVVALTLNLCVADGCVEDSGDLALWILPDEFCTVSYDEPDACPKHFSIPEALQGKTVAELLAAANAALAGDTTYSLGDIYTAVTAINEGFDECATLVSCGPGIEICDNGCDDDWDGLIDSEDPDCAF